MSLQVEDTQRTAGLSTGRATFKVSQSGIWCDKKRVHMNMTVEPAINCLPRRIVMMIHRIWNTTAVWKSVVVQKHQENRGHSIVLMLLRALIWASIGLPGKYSLQKSCCTYQPAIASRPPPRPPHFNTYRFSIFTARLCMQYSIQFLKDPLQYPTVGTSKITISTVNASIVLPARQNQHIQR